MSLAPASDRSFGHEAKYFAQHRAVSRTQAAMSNSPPYAISRVVGLNAKAPEDRLGLLRMPCYHSPASCKHDSRPDIFCATHKGKVSRKRWKQTVILDKDRSSVHSTPRVGRRSAAPYMTPSACRRNASNVALRQLGHDIVLDLTAESSGLVWTIRMMVRYAQYSRAGADHVGNYKEKRRWKIEKRWIVFQYWYEMLHSTYLHVFQAILLTDAPQHVLLAALLHLSCQQQLIQDEISFLEVEDDV